MYYTYILLGYLLLPVLIVRLLLKSIKNPLYRQKIAQRLGFCPKNSAPLIWIHCVSIGEFQAAVALIDALFISYPKHKILLTSTTPTGSTAIIQHYKNKVLHCYFPFDLWFSMWIFSKRIKPKICILLETEIWANLAQILSKNKIPLLLINARLSTKSCKKYQKIAPKFTHKTLQKFSLIATQNQKSTENFIKLGADKNKLITLNNLKFEQNPQPNKTVNQQLQKIICKRKVVVFASTHSGEERSIMRSYLHYKSQIEALLIIIPRHPERFHSVFKLAQKMGISMQKRSNNQNCATTEMLLGDSMGEMTNYFNICDIAFIGGSLSKTGGHNMLEPAALGKPIIFGENVFNFAQISDDLQAQNAALQVQNADELFALIIHLFKNDKQCQTLAENAKRYFLSKQGSLNKLLPLIAKNID